MAEEATSLVSRTIMRREAQAFVRYERGMCRAYDALLTVTQEDRERLVALASGREREALARKMTVVPICVDPSERGAVPR